MPRKRDHRQLSIHVGQSKIIPNRSNKRAHTYALNQSLCNNPVQVDEEKSAEIKGSRECFIPKLTIKRVSSQEVLREDEIPSAVKSANTLNTGPRERKIIQSPTFKTVSKELASQEGSRYNFNYTPIKNSFFRGNSRKNIPKIEINQINMNNDNLTPNQGTINTMGDLDVTEGIEHQEDVLNTSEARRRRFEEKLQEELADAEFENMQEETHKEAQKFIYEYSNRKNKRMKKLQKWS